MKKITFLIMAISCTSVCVAQNTTPDTTKKDRRNVIGIDVTGLAQEFIGFNSYPYGYPYYGSPYLLQYKRIFHVNALRVGFGGNASKDNGRQNDTLHSARSRTQFNIGIGFEHYSYLAKRWNLFCGIDAIMNYTNDFYESSRTATTSYSTENTNYGYGFSPLLGIQFRINSRMSVATETSFDVTWTRGKSTQREVPSTGYDKDGVGTGFQTQLHAPLGIVFRVMF
ncbi:MAG: hypothetical protein ACJ77K_14455 [Bacteroidia bacterium]